MGIELQDIKSFLYAIKSHSEVIRGDLLILGDATLHFSNADFIAICKELALTINHHHDKLDAIAMGRALGFDSVDTLDINGKATITIDLQQPLPKKLVGRYSCILDAGVLFWCYDPGAVLRNLCLLMTGKALVMHITALSGHYGRGYYNIHPRLFEDFYLGNNFSFVHASYRCKPWWKDFFMLLLRIFSVNGDNMFVRYTHSTGCFYLSHSTAMAMSFARQPSRTKQALIPNDAVGTFVFRRMGGKTMANGPVQIG